MQKPHERRTPQHTRDTWAAVSAWPQASIRTIALVLGRRTDEVRYDLDQLEQLGYIDRDPHARSARRINVSCYDATIAQAMQQVKDMAHRVAQRTGRPRRTAR